MFNILLVDDEMLSRNSLKYLFTSIDSQFHICGEASNGLEALAFLSTNMPDVIITDMKMPEMDGLSLIKEVRSQYPSLQIIALSNYDDIEYVRSSLKYGIIDYWLKHEVSLTLIEQTFSQVKQKLPESLLRPEQKYISSNKQKIRQSFILNLLSGMYMSSKDVAANSEILDFPILHTVMMPVILHINHYTKHIQDNTLSNISIFSFTVMNIVEELVDSINAAHIVNLSPQNYCLFFAFQKTKSEQTILSSINEYVELISSTLLKFLNITLTVSMGKLCHDYQELPDSFHCAEIKIQNKFYENSEKRISSVHQPASLTRDNYHSPYYSSLGLPYALEQDVSTALKLSDNKKILQALDTIYHYIDNENLNISECQRVFSDLYNIGSLTCKINGLIFEEICTPTITINDIFSEEYNLSEFKEFFRNCFLCIASSLKGKNTDSEYVNQALALIHEKYSSDITLYTTADEIGISSAYLSTIFKQAVGIGFSQYLNQFRIDKALVYLESGKLSLHEVAYHCGYQNYDYFFKVFKKITGQTPGTYFKRKT